MMAVMEPSVITLDNGLKAVHLRVPGSAVGYTGVVVRAGSRDELSPREFGLAHFVEHTLFKGTTRRSSWHIINRMEAVGGELNAYTTKENTVVYTAFPRRHLGRALELIADLITSSCFPETEVNREREVIADELNSYLDSPADAVLDDFEDKLFEGSGLGHNILGTLDSVSSITSADCRRWLDRYYAADNMVAYYAGPLGLDAFVRQLEQYFGALPVKSDIRPRTNRGEATVTGHHFDCHRPIDSHQAHVVMGTSLPLLDYENRLSLALLTNILGGPGMNSKLNVALRERRGLVYTVESSMTNWTDSTMFSTYFGTDPEDLDKCITLVKDTIASLAAAPLTHRALLAAQKQYLGQLVLARENVENRVQGIARSVLAGYPVLTPAEVSGRVKAVTPEALRDTAIRLTQLSCLAFVPRS